MAKRSTKKKICEACNEAEVQWTLKDEYHPDVKYRVCSNCLIFLVRNALRKKQYFNLLKNGHDENEFLLHDDFYDRDGNATQPN